MITIQEHVDLLPYNTFKIRSVARYYINIKSADEFKSLIKTDVYKREKRFILGGGSNILLASAFNGLVIKVDIKGISKVEENEGTITLKIGAGELWHAVVMHCVSQDWGGIENLSLIPGTIGAAPMQNIGAYGVEIKNVIKNVEAIDLLSGETKVFSNDQCEFGYRESVFKQKVKGKYFISSVTLTLTKKNHHFNTSYGAIETTLKQHGVNALSVRSISDAVIAIRQQKLPDPAVIGNAGSFFKNPTITKALHDKLKLSYPDIPGYATENQEVKLPAAWLIEQCGWKGKTFSSVGVHQHQALVLVNYGDGTGEEIWNLAQKILASVKDKFEIELQPEVNVIS